MQILSGFRSLLGSVIRLGVGEVLSRIASFLFIAYIARRFGVQLLGVVALSQTVAMYVMLGTDQGLRMAGARLVARNSAASPWAINKILGKRIISCGVCVALGSIYALLGPVPQSARSYVFAFVLGVIPYAFSLDWLAWGLGKFAWLGAYRAGVTIIFVFGAVFGIFFSHSTFWPIALANGLAVTVGSLMLWIPWRFRWKQEVGILESSVDEDSRRNLSWLTVLPLGVATLLTQAFHNFDTIMLGAMSSTAEVGRYNSAYRILFLILGSYWLVTNALYPRMSRAQNRSGAQKFVLGAILAVGIAGTVIAIVISILAPTILKLIYGSDLTATRLLRVLVFAIPMDFCVALLGALLVSRGRDRALLTATGSAAALNVLFNLFLIPKLNGMGAAIATVVSYAYLLLFLLQYIIRKPIFELGTSPVALAST